MNFESNFSKNVQEIVQEVKVNAHTVLTLRAIWALK
jgi:hypothetical protein